MAKGKTKRDYCDRVHSDQMVLGLSGGEAGPREQWPKTLKARVNLGQMVLVVVRQGGCTA
jgi:hypothetical protein